MIKSLKKFWKDYILACKAGIDFYKNHWFGSIIFVIVYTSALFGGLWFWNKHDQKKKIIERCNESESESEE